MHHRHTDNKESIGWRERLVAAIAAPLVFNLSLVLLFGMFFRGRRGLAGVLLFSPIVSAVLLVVPAAVGLMVGIDRFAIDGVIDGIVDLTSARSS